MVVVLVGVVVVVVLPSPSCSCTWACEDSRWSSRLDPADSSDVVGAVVGVVAADPEAVLAVLPLPSCSCDWACEASRWSSPLDPADSPVEVVVFDVDDDPADPPDDPADPAEDELPELPACEACPAVHPACPEVSPDSVACEVLEVELLPACWLSDPPDLAAVWELSVAATCEPCDADTWDDVEAAPALLP